MTHGSKKNSRRKLGNNSKIGNTAYPNLCDIAKAVYKEKLIYLNPQNQKVKRLKINDLQFHLEELKNKGKLNSNLMKKNIVREDQKLTKWKNRNKQQNPHLIMSKD